MGYYRCEICGNVVKCDDDRSKTLMCCNKLMTKCEEKTKDETLQDKHLPVYTREGNKICITVGEMLHPSGTDHYIMFIKMITNKGEYVRKLGPGDKPECCFWVNDDEEIISINSYCNIHGFWKKTLTF